MTYLCIVCIELFMLLSVYASQSMHNIVATCYLEISVLMYPDLHCSYSFCILPVILLLCTYIFLNDRVSNTSVYVVMYLYKPYSLLYAALPNHLREHWSGIITHRNTEMGLLLMYHSHSLTHCCWLNLPTLLCVCMYMYWNGLGLDCHGIWWDSPRQTGLYKKRCWSRPINMTQSLVSQGSSDGWKLSSVSNSTSCLLWADGRAQEWEVDCCLVALLWMWLGIWDWYFCFWDSFLQNLGKWYAGPMTIGPVTMG